VRVAEQENDVRTAVVIVHGMGEQMPLETLNKFVKTALPKFEGERHYFSHPARIADSYEARRLLAYRQPFHGPPLHGQVEFFEYHWSYMMTDNKLSDIVPTLLRLMLRSRRTVPWGLRKVWLIVWLVALLTLIVAIAIVVAGVKFEEFTLSGVLTALLGQTVIVTLLVKVAGQLGDAVTKSFVDVVRYLDRSPRSYNVRRQIRKGMVELLTDIHDRGTYTRVVVVAHSLGAFIAYDAITWLWPEMCKLHEGPIRGGGPEKLPGLHELHELARQVDEHPTTQLTDEQKTRLDDFRRQQFELWRTLRKRGNPWLITDLITVGTPMYFADLLYTRDRASFEDLVKRAELPQCPPKAGDQMVEGDQKPAGRRYGFNNKGHEVLIHGAPFAVVRWSNLYFPAEDSWHGDWFGGPLRPLFGRGIEDLPVLGNLPGRLAPGIAHARYFTFPESDGPDDMPTVLQKRLQLNIDAQLIDLLRAPLPLKETDSRPQTMRSITDPPEGRQAVPPESDEGASDVHQ